MKVKLTNGIRKFSGAQMGRSNQPVSGKCHMQLVKMCSCCGAYDHAGAYWGIDTPLYVCQDSNGNQFFTRAASRNQAKTNILEHNNPITFYR